MSLKESKAKLVHIQNNLVRIVASELSRLTPDMEDLNREQLSTGKDAHGQDTPNYKPSTRKQGRIKFHDTGDFYKSIKADVKGKVVVIDSKDSKAPYLKNWKGRVKTLGLSPKSTSIIGIKLKSSMDSIISKLIK